MSENAHFIDARGLEPPEPFARTMDALDRIAPGETLVLLLAREPFPLYRALELNGFAWKTERTAGGDYSISIFHRKA